MYVTYFVLLLAEQRHWSTQRVSLNKYCNVRTLLHTVTLRSVYKLILASVTKTCSLLSVTK